MRFLSATLSLLIVSVAAAQVEVTSLGQPAPDLEIRTDNSQTVERKVFIGDLRGRIYVMYFWRSGNAESLNILPKMQALAKKMHAKGVRLYYMSMDTKSRYDQVAKDHNLEMREEEAFWNCYSVATLFGAMAAPQVVIIDSQGFIAWRGHPMPLDRLEERLEDLVADTRPLAGDSKEIDYLFREADKHESQGEYGKAYSIAKLLFSASDKESKDNNRAKGQMDKLEAAAAKWLQEGVEAEHAGDIKKAARIVSEISVRFENKARDKDKEKDRDTQPDVVRDARNEISRMNGDRKLKEAIREASEQAKAEMKLDEAGREERADRFDSALEMYYTVLDDYKDTEAAKTAQASIDRIHSDAKLRDRAAKSRAQGQARALYDIGARFAELDLSEQARQNFERIVSDYPSSRYVDRAKKQLANLKPAPAKATADAAKPAGKDAKP